MLDLEGALFFFFFSRKKEVQLSVLGCIIIQCNFVKKNRILELKLEPGGKEVEKKGGVMSECVSALSDEVM